VSGATYSYLIQWLEDRYSNYDSDTMNTLYNVELRIGSVGQLFDDVATAMLLITLVEIGNGFLYILTQTRTGLQKGVRWGTISTAGIIVVLAIAHLGVTNSFWSKYFDYRAGTAGGEALTANSIAKDMKTISQVSSAVIILFWVTTLPLIAFASYVVHMVKNIPLLRSVSLARPQTWLEAAETDQPRIHSRPSSSSSQRSCSSLDSPGYSHTPPHGFSRTNRTEHL
jgi:hypothetical protein